MSLLARSRAPRAEIACIRLRWQRDPRTPGGRKPGRLRSHASLDQLLRAHVEVEAQLPPDVAGDVGRGAGQPEEAPHGKEDQAGAASSAAVTARA